MPQAIEQGIDQRFVLEQAAPLVAGGVDGDEGGGALVAFIEQREQGVALFRLETEVSQLVDQQDRIPGQAPDQPARRLIGQGCVESVDQILGLVETAAVVMQQDRSAVPGFDAPLPPYPAHPATQPPSAPDLRSQPIHCQPNTLLCHPY